MENIKPFEIKKVQKIIESKETEGLLNCISNLEIHAESIGEGGNAEVFAIDDSPFSKVCLKKIKENPQIRCNTIDRENELQIAARNAGVRTPVPLISFEANDQEYLIMERIIGFNVEEVLKNPSLLTDKFEFKSFFNDLENQIEKMHANGIFHRDLHSRNVMIAENGMPVIIDFGTATEGSGSDFTYEELASVYNEKTNKYDQVTGKFKDDVIMVRNLKSAMMPLVKSLLTNNNK